MNSKRNQHFYMFWLWFTTLFAIILFGYGFITSLIQLDIWGLTSWGIGFVLWCIGGFLVTNYFSDSYRFKW